MPTVGIAGTNLRESFDRISFDNRGIGLSAQGPSSWSASTCSRVA